MLESVAETAVSPTGALLVGVHVAVQAGIIIVIFARMPTWKRFAGAPFLALWAFVAIQVLRIVDIDLTGGSYALRLEIIHTTGTAVIIIGPLTLLWMFVGRHLLYKQSSGR